MPKKWAAEPPKQHTYSVNVWPKYTCLDQSHQSPARDLERYGLNRQIWDNTQCLIWLDYPFWTIYLRAWRRTLWRTGRTRGGDGRNFEIGHFRHLTHSETKGQDSSGLFHRGSVFAPWPSRQDRNGWALLQWQSRDLVVAAVRLPQQHPILRVDRAWQISWEIARAGTNFWSWAGRKVEVVGLIVGLGCNRWVSTGAKRCVLWISNC